MTISLEASLTLHYRPRICTIKRVSCASPMCCTCANVRAYDLNCVETIHEYSLVSGRISALKNQIAFQKIGTGPFLAPEQ